MNKGLNLQHIGRPHSGIGECCRPAPFPSSPRLLLWVRGICLGSGTWSRLRASQRAAKSPDGGREEDVLGLARGKSSWSLARPSVANTACPSGQGAAPLLGYSQCWGWGWMWAAPGLTQCPEHREGVPRLGEMLSLSGQSSSCAGCCICPWNGGSARRCGRRSWLETRCRVKMRGPSWRTESWSRLLTRVMSFVVPQPAPR